MRKSSFVRIVFALGTSLVFTGLFSSCVSTKEVRLSAADRAAMRGKTFTVSSRKMPHHAVIKQSAMAAASLGGAVGGVIAGGIADHEGRVQVEKHRIPNPDEVMNREVAKAVAAKTGAKQVASRGTTTSTDPKKVAASNIHADYVLDCFLTSWTGMYYPMSFGKYYMVVGAKMQLIETATGRVVSEGFSLYQGNDKEHAPDYDGIYSNGAAFFKTETNKGVYGAIGKFVGQF